MGQLVRVKNKPLNLAEQKCPPARRHSKPSFAGRLWRRAGIFARRFKNASHAFGTLIYHLISFGVFQLFWNFFGCHGRGVPTFLSSDSPSTFFYCSPFLPQTRCWKLFLDFTWKSDLYNLGIFKTPFSHNFWRKELFKSPWYNSFRQFISRIILN